MQHQPDDQHEHHPRHRRRPPELPELPALLVHEQAEGLVLVAGPPFGWPSAEQQRLAEQLGGPDRRDHDGEQDRGAQARAA